MGDAGQNGQNGLSWFTGPGVDVEVTSLSVSASGATVEFTLDDLPGSGGAPVDRTGWLTQGAVNVAFVLAQRGLDDAGVPAQHTAYTVRTVAGGAQATSEAVEANFQVVDVSRGAYRYTFGAPLTGFDPTLPQTVLAVARRGVALDRDLFSTHTDGGVPTPHTVVESARCAACHGSLTAHDGRFDAVEQCAVCHTPQSREPVSGNTLDLQVMVHRIHRGAALASVVGGGTYRLVGGDGGVHDYATVRYPQSLERCDSCHGGAQGNQWQTRPSVEACTSCHDGVSFVDPPPAGTVPHTAGVPATAACAVCHPATGGVSAVVDRHVDPSFDTSHALELTIRPLRPIGPGSTPSFTFAVKVDGQPRDIVATPLATLRATLAGPNGDFGTMFTSGTLTNPWVQATIQGAGATGVLTAVDAANGVFSYSFPSTITLPLITTGSYTVGLEATLNATEPRFAATSPMHAFAVTDAVARERRSVIDADKCNACHFNLSAHGGLRRGAAACVLCHSPRNANDERSSRFEGSTVLAESLDFRVMVHKVHAGAQRSQPYVLFGSPGPTTTNPTGTPLDFGATRYPRPLTQCEACHRPGTWTLPASQGRLPSILQELTCTEPGGNDTDNYCTSPFWNVTRTLTLAPETAVCTSCHDQPYTRVHAELMTSSSGEESCTTCHGAGRSQDVARVHGP